MQHPESEVNDGDILRAQTWKEYIGQTKLKARLSMYINAAKATGNMLPHVLLDGSPGYGKTTLAQIIATEMDDRFVFIKVSKQMSTSVLENIVKSFEGGILFLDEIHCASPAFQHELLTLMEDKYMMMKNGRRLVHKYITVIGATTDPEALLKPLRDRFDLRPYTGVRFEEYSDQDMTEIIFGMAYKVGLGISEEVGNGLGRAAGGVPRLAKQFVAAGLAIQEGSDEEPTVEAILDLLDIDLDGLTGLHMHYLRSLNELGGVGGLDKLANMTDLQPSSLKDLEKLLIRRGYIVHGTKGRELTKSGIHKARGTTAEDKYRTFAA